MYDQICAFDNLYTAYRQARTGKRTHPDVAAFEFNLEAELIQLRDELAGRTYRPGPYHSFHIHEPKRRLISAAPFRDRVVHHALCNVIEPIFERRFIGDSYANRVGKGTQRALDRCTQWMRRFKYVMPLDVVQFFPSIDHALLRGVLARAIHDPDTRGLIDVILQSGAGVLADSYDMVWFPGDDLFAAARPRGLPIGNLTSQFWANVYLNEFDQFAKRRLGVRGYVRYVDDIVLFADDPAQLHDWHARSVEFLARLRLTVHQSQPQPRPVAEGLPFLGFVVYPDHRRLKRRKVVYAR
ncbi:MAG: RNA-dependent DNA polymerase, partial [Chloroflexi bacterium]|nr:RNA-dependent DNA polymerase [Chloroflexota bacterium]